MKRMLAVTFALCLGGLQMNAQTVDGVKYCGQVGRTAKFFEQHPHCVNESRIAQDQLEAEYAESMANRGGDMIIYTIPVVFHIIHNNGEENISDEQIFDALNILNRDFRKLNPDTASVVEAFEDIIADVGIEFRLASKDPFGNCHPGINRVQSELTTEGGSEMKALSVWPRDSYMNIWVCADAGEGAAGYTFLPATVNGGWGQLNDGIVLRHDYTGSIGTSSPFRSRTLTHEVGHWINLFHTWGPGNSPNEPENCDIDDLVEDTPNTIGFLSCNLSGASCGNEIDNVQNYMEYSYCSRMFTIGQALRMRAALTSPIAERNELITESNLIETGVINPELCSASFDIDMNSGCVGQEMQFFDVSYHGVTEWTWNFGDGTVITGSDPLIYKNPVHVYDTPGVYTVSLTVGNGTETLSATINNALTIFEEGLLESPLEEGFEATFPDNKWIIYNVNGGQTFEITPSAQFSGDKSLRLRNFSNQVAGSVDYFLSASYDMSAMDTVWLSYKWAYASKATEQTNDRLRIQVSGDCGTTWSTRRTRTGEATLATADPMNNQFTPTSTAQWNGETIIIADSIWMTDGFRIRFEFTGQGGNNFFIDDINLTSSDTVTQVISGVSEVSPLFLYSVYPNPASENATLHYVSTQTESITVKLYNALGQMVGVIYDGQIGSGEYYWNIPRPAAGIYTVVFEKPGYRATEKVMFSPR